jgi:hypothetical protein
MSKKPSVHIEMCKCKSSMLEEHGYDPGTKTLAVTFANGGGSYRFSGVPQSVYDEMVKAESIGRYFAAHIRGNKKYSFKRPEKARTR